MSSVNGYNDTEQYNDDFDTTKDSYLCFIVDGETYAVEITQVFEIIKICDITRVPENPDYVKGIINLRGDIVPVISVRTRFGKPEIPFDDKTCIIVLEYGEHFIGLIVDEVSGGAKITDDQILPAPSAKLSYANLFIKNLGKSDEGITLILDVEKLLFA